MFAVVEVTVAFLAQALDAVGIAQDLPFGAQRVIFSGNQLCPHQLAELELHQFPSRMALAVIHAQAVEALAEPLDLGECLSQLIPLR